MTDMELLVVGLMGYMGMGFVYSLMVFWRRWKNYCESMEPTFAMTNKMLGERLFGGPRFFEYHGSVMDWVWFVVIWFSFPIFMMVGAHKG